MRSLLLSLCLASILWAQDEARRVLSPITGQRMALVIGNAAYTWKPLANPVNDARDVADSLRRAGFDPSNIRLVVNADGNQLRRSVREFVESIKQGDFALIYYSGHGIEVRGQNYLLPVDLPSSATEGFVQDESISAQRVLDDLTLQGARVKVLILDACRDNPLRASKSTGGGLARMEGKGSLVVFATEAGKTASDSPQERNGLFTRYLLAGLEQRGIALDEAMKQVSRNVAKATNEQQVPAIYGLLLEDVILLPANSQPDTSASVASKAAPEDSLTGAAQKEDPADWLRKRAESGNIKAQAELGAWYAQGLVVKKNIPEAMKWLQMAADRGSPEAEYNLSLLYAKGVGVRKDEALSTQLLLKAAEQGHPDAQYYVGQMYRTGDGGIKQDLTKAKSWYIKAAEQGQKDAQSNLGALYHEGLGGPKDYNEAVKWTAKAAEEGDASAQHNLGLMYRKGEGVEKDDDKATEWIRKSAEQGYAAGESQMGIAYYFGLGVRANKEEAVNWLQKAVDQGEPQAEFNLAICYSKGEGGLKQDYEKAMILLQRSAGHGYQNAKDMLDKLISK